MILKLELRQLLTDACKGTISPKGLSRLIQVTRSLAENYLKYYRASVVQVLSFHGITIGDLANDCIGEIFARNEHFQFQVLGKFVQSLKSPLQDIDELDLLLAYKGLTIKVSKTQLARTYAQSDPAGAKIYRNLKDATKRSPDFKTIEDFRGHVLCPRTCEPLDHKPPYPIDRLEEEIRQSTSLLVETPQVLASLASVLFRQDVYRRAIPLFDLVTIVRNAYARASSMEGEQVDHVNLEGLAHNDLQYVREQVLYAVNERIVTTYFNKGKMKKEEALQLSAIMTSIINEWFEEGESTNSYYRHASGIRPMKEEEYESQWRKRIEYLSRIARELIASYLQDDI